METEKGARRQQLYQNLLTALHPHSEENQGTFAAREAVAHSQGFILKSFNVEGVGELQLPLSAEHASKLRCVCEKVPVGDASETRMNWFDGERRHWQVDASRVTFPRKRTFLSSTVPSLAVGAVRALGLPGAWAQLEVHLSKLLVFETGGLCAHRDTEKEKGVFATLLLQLPTEEGYTGGELLVEHGNKSKLFDSQVISTVGFCYTIFFADCLHELQRINSGTILCLAFNLVNGDSSWDPVHREFIPTMVQEVEAALTPWLEEATARKLDIFGDKLAIPLQHKYTDKDLSFTGLKGTDNRMAEVLKNCRDKNKDKCLDLHLCPVTKHQFGEILDGESSPNAADQIYEVLEEDIQFKWIGLNNKTALAFEKLKIDMDKEVVGTGEDPFDSDAPPGGKKVNTYSEGLPFFESRFHTAMLVAWPKALSILIACETSVPCALDLMERTLEISDPNFRRQLHQVIRYCKENASKVWGEREDSVDSVTPRLINICTQANALEGVLNVFLLLKTALPCTKKFDRTGIDDKFYIGVRTVEVAGAIAAAIQVFGWESVSARVIGLVKKCALGQRDGCAEIAKLLICMGKMDAGEQVASTMPVFSWRQPLANLPDYPEIESFLRGPGYSFTHKNLGDIDAARSFEETYFNINQEESPSAGYSARGTPGGQGREAFCVI